MYRSLSRFALPFVLTLAAACAESATAPTVRDPNAPSLAVAPTGETATVTACDGKLAGVAMTWPVVAGAPYTWTTIGAYDPTTGALVYTDVGGTARIAPYTAGWLGTWVPFGTWDMKVFQWQPNGAGGLTASSTVIIRLDVTRKLCPKGR